MNSVNTEYPFLKKINWDMLFLHKSELSSKMVASLGSSSQANIAREYTFIEKICSMYSELISVQSQIAELRELLNDKSNQEDLGQIAEDELQSLKYQQENLSKQLENAIYESEDESADSCYIEIRSGAGGLEASLFVSDLSKMYLGFADKKKIFSSVESTAATDVGGYREVVLFFKHKNIYDLFRYEAGVHRVQRVPTTETAGRVHTSTVTVAVLPEAKEVDVSINPEDLRIDTYRAGGAGGQHVNKTDSAVRITHIPTGTVVACQDERSQHKNKAKAMKILRSRILASEKEKQHNAMSEMRKQMVATGDRSEKVRTYNYPQNRVTDHQVGLTLNKLDMIMQGNLDEIINALSVWARGFTPVNPYLKPFLVN